MPALVVAVLACVAAGAPAADPATRPGALDQLVADLRARGEPATPEDLRPPAVKPEENAALLYEKAAASLDPGKAGPRSSAETFGDDLPYPPQWHRLADENVRGNRTALDLVRQATTRPAVAWTPGPGADLLSSQLQNLGGQRGIANSVADAALQAHFSGNDRDALLLLRAELRHGDAVGQRPFLVSKLVMFGIMALSANNAQVLSTELTVEGAKHPIRAGVQSPAPRAAVQEIVNDLLNDAKVVAPWRQMFREERVYAIESLRAKQVPAPPAEQSLPALSRLYEGYMAAADQPSWGEAVAVPDDPFCKVVAPAFGKSRQLLAQALLLRRMAAVSLAVALYRNDQGEFPPDLGALAPKYLPAVPVDPFSRTKQAIQYGVMDGKRPMVGSVGPDGVDAALPQLGMPEGARYSFPRAGEGEADDIWLDLSAWPGKK